MKSIKRKLRLQAQTLRNLSVDQLGHIAGGASSQAATRCSTYQDTGCLPTGTETEGRLPTNYGCTGGTGCSTQC